jgi:hypothetical protein
MKLRASSTKRMAEKVKKLARYNGAISLQRTLQLFFSLDKELLILERKEEYSLELFFF